MPARLALSPAAAAIALLLGLAACQGKGKETDAMDRELIGNSARSDQTDPALTSALEDQIMVDPSLAQQKGAAGRPGAAPAQAPIPATRPAPGIVPGADRGMAHAPPPKPSTARTGLTLGELAKMQASPKSGPKDCTRAMQYSLAWAQRLPAALPLYPQAQVSEAAGNVTDGCNLRVVSFTSGAPLGRLVDFYFTHATRAGYDAEHKISGSDHILAGDRDDDAFYATFRAHQGGGTDVDLVANGGR